MIRQAVRSFEDRERVFLVQRVIPGSDYRIVVLDKEVISAYERRPLSITGDGRSTINGLLRKKQAEFIAAKRDTIIPADDFRINNTLKRSGLTRSSRLKSGQQIALMPNANLSTGGEAIDITSALHAEWASLCVCIARDMNLRFAGIDVLSEQSLDEPPQKYVVLEVNSAPGLDNYASLGKQQKERVKAMYQEVIMAMLT